MRRNRIRLGWSLCFCFLGLGLTAAFAHNGAGPYATILKNDVFRLKPPPVTVPQQPPEPAAKIRLTGISTLFAHKLALLKVQLPPNGHQPAQEFDLSLGEGQHEKEIQVLAIDVKARQVQLLNHGTHEVVTFQPEKAAAPATPHVPPPLLRPTLRFAHR